MDGMCAVLLQRFACILSRTLGSSFGVGTLPGVALARLGVPNTLAHKALVSLGDIGLPPGLASTLWSNSGTRSIIPRTFVGTLSGVGLALRGVPKLALALAILQALVILCDSRSLPLNLPAPLETTSEEPEMFSPEEPLR